MTENASSPLTLFNLTGQVALVTGGVGGLGRPIAVGLAAAGATVVVADLTVDQADKVLAEIAASGRPGLALPLDVTSAASVQSVVDRLLADYGRIDILVNVPLRLTSMIRAQSASRKSMAAIRLVTLWQLLCCQRVGRVMIQQGRGSIINLASIGGLVGLPTSVAYCASKGGVVQLTRTLGVEWAP